MASPTPAGSVSPPQPAQPIQPAKPAEPQPPITNGIVQPKPAAPISPPTTGESVTEPWFKGRFRVSGASAAIAARLGHQWNKDAPPLPVHGNAVTAYVDVQAYYTAVGATILKARPKMSDFIYIAGWELDLGAFVDPVGSKQRRTLRDLLGAAAQSGVEIRALLDSTTNLGANIATAMEIENMGGGAIVDPFHLLTGSQHQKMVIVRTAEGVVAFCGGCDIARHRLGRDGYTGPPITKSGPSPDTSAPWHDVQVKVEGGAAADLWQTFVQRFKEVADAAIARNPNKDPAGLRFSGLYGAPSLRLPTLQDAQRVAGSHDVQVVRTYVNASKPHPGDALIMPPGKPGYAFASKGETGYYEALVHAIGRANSTIYLEDQYLVESASMANLGVLTDALGRTISKSSFQKMVIVIAGTPTVQPELFQAASRRAKFINQLGHAAQTKVAVYVYAADVNSPYWFHSKTWIFDDTFAITGSANCNRRSYSCDSEVGVAVADGGPGGFAKSLRMSLWIKHLNARRSGSSGGLPAYGVRDVEDFVGAAKLWDAGKPLLVERVNLPADTTPDIPLTEHELVKHFSLRVGQAVGQPLATNVIKALLGGSDKQWSLLDPDGS